MIHPIDSMSPIQNTSPIACGKSLAPNRFGDTMVYGRRNGPFLTFVINLLSTVWQWIKYDVLFLFFDRREDKKKKLNAEIEKYWTTYETMAFSDPDAGSETMRNEFKKLDPKLKKIMEEQIIQVLKEASPRMEEKALQVEMKNVLANPYTKVTDQDKFIIGEALGKASEKIAGYQE